MYVRQGAYQALSHLIPGKVSGDTADHRAPFLFSSNRYLSIENELFNGRSHTVTTAMEFVLTPCSRCGGQRDTAHTRCKACLAEVRRRNLDAPQYQRDNKRLQRAGRRAREGATVEHVDTSLIYERDGGLCQLCGQQVQRDGDEQCFDHIIPLALGGGHTVQNLQLAHMQCNIWKGSHVQAIHLPLVESVSLSEHRRRAGLTQRAVADMMGVTKNTVQNWESGSLTGAAGTAPRSNCRPLLAQVLGISRLDLESSLYELDCLALPIGG